MVILFAASDYFEKGKATEGFPIYLHRITAALVGMGHTPIIVACGNTDKHYFQDGVENYIVRIAYPEILVKSIETGYGVLCRSRAVNKKIQEISKARKVDIIQFTSLWGLAICYRGKIPAVMRLSSYAKIYYATDSVLGRQEVNVLAFSERLAASRCNAVFAPCKNTADNFARDIGRQVSVIETPFVNETTDYDESIYRRHLEKRKYVLFFGTLLPVKGILIIAGIMHRFLKDHPEYYMVCCGKSVSINGKNAVNILRDTAGELKDRFLYIPPLSHEQLYPIIQHADFVILPSLVENLSNACIEAMYFERVVIGTDGVSFEQLIDDGMSGLLCQPNDEDSLLEKMNKAVAMDETQKREMGKAARKRIDGLKPELAVKKLLRYYQYIMDRISK